MPSGDLLIYLFILSIELLVQKLQTLKCIHCVSPLFIDH